MVAAWVESEFQRLRDENKESFEEIREGLERAGSGVRKTFKSLLKKRKKAKKGSKSNKKTD